METFILPYIVAILIAATLIGIMIWAVRNTSDPIPGIMIPITLGLFIFGFVFNIGVTAKKATINHEVSTEVFKSKSTLVIVPDGYKPITSDSLRMSDKYTNGVYKLPTQTVINYNIYGNVMDSKTLMNGDFVLTR